jgi:Glucose / Sorbosone dehydrogenase
VRRITLLVATCLAVLVPSASAAAVGLVPIAPETDWGSMPLGGAAPAGDQRLFVVERGGVVRIINEGVLQERPFLRIPGVDTETERGLLSIAFAPDYASSGLFYVFMVGAGPDAIDPAGQRGDVRVVEFHRSAASPDIADLDSGRLVIKQAHNNGNHNGGQVFFGPEGLLYVTIGENETPANSQDLGNLLGKLLRIDPRRSGVAPYTVPASNPFLATPGARPEIYALGLRNPFRASFAPNGDLVLPDVGDHDWEEVNVGRATGTPAATTLAGANLGWPICEGVCSPPDTAFFDPVFQYPHEGPETSSGCAIIGGYVVRDKTLTGLTGRYLYGDTCRQDLRTLDFAVAGADPRAADTSYEGGALTGMGEDGRGCTYVFTTLTAYRVAPSSTASPACPAAALGPPDTRKPRLLLGGAQRQRLRQSLRVFARCDEHCSLRATAALRLSSPARQNNAREASLAATAAVKLPVTKRSVAAGKRVRLLVKVRPASFRRAVAALRAGSSATARLRVSATDGAGNVSRKVFRVKLAAPTRR